MNAKRARPFHLPQLPQSIAHYGSQEYDSPVRWELTEIASRSKEIARIAAKTVGQPRTLAESTSTVEIALPVSRGVSQPAWVPKVRFHASAAAGKAIPGALKSNRVLVYGYSDEV